MKKRTIALFMAAVMLFGIVVGGTVAWLTVKSDPVTNTFTVGDININLTEADVNVETTVDDTTTYTYAEYVKDNQAGATYADADRVASNVYELIPGASYSKDPKVTVLKGSEPCYVYVKVTETNNDDDTIIYTVDTTKWTLVAGYTDLYWYNTALDAADADVMTESVITNSKITINTALTKTDMHPTDGTTYAKPQLEFLAAAVQSANIDRAVADTQAADLLGATKVTQ